MIGTSRPLEPADVLTHAWNSPSADGVHAHGTCESARDHGSGVKGWTLWAFADSKTRQGARSEIRDDWLCCVRDDLWSRGSVAMAVRGCAQVRTALDNSPVLFADVFCARRTACMHRRVVRRRVVGHPRSGCPLPNVAGDVVEAVPVWRKSLHR